MAHCHTAIFNAGLLRITLAISLLSSIPLLTGCDRSEPAPVVPTQTAPATDPLKIPDPGLAQSNSDGPAVSQPDESSTSLSLAQRLAGRWICYTDGPMTSLEFLPQGQMLAHGNLAQTLHDPVRTTYTYQTPGSSTLVLQDEAGARETYTLQFAGSDLQLQSSSNQIHRFRRLPASVSFAEAAAYLWQVKSDIYAGRPAAIKKFISKPGLILTIATGQADQPQVIAINPQNSQGAAYTGRAWYDTRPTLTAFAKLVILQNPDTLTTTVSLHLGKPEQPENESSSAPSASLPITQGEIILSVQGDNQHLRIIGSHIPAGPSATITLTHDTVRYQAIITRFPDEQKRLQDIQADMINALKDFAILRGNSDMAGDQGRSSDQIILIRDLKSPDPLWKGEIQIRPPDTHLLLPGQPNRKIQTLHFAAAQVSIQNNQAVLTIPAGSKIYTYQLHGQMTGQWYQIGQKDTYKSNLQIIQASDYSDYMAMLQAKRNKLAAITPTQTLGGFVPVGMTLGEKTPMVISLNITPNGQVSAQAYYTLYRTLASYKGHVIETLLGPAIYMELDDLPLDQKNVRVPLSILGLKLREQKWSLTLPDTGPSLQMEGYITDAVQTPIRLEDITETWKTRHQTLLNQVLTAQTPLVVTYPHPKNPLDAATFTLEAQPDTADGAPGVITGKVTATTGTMAGLNQPATITGKITQIGPWSGVNLKITPDAAPDQPYVAELILFENQSRPALSGIFYPQNAPQAETYVQFQLKEEAIGPVQP